MHSRAAGARARVKCAARTRRDARTRPRSVACLACASYRAQTITAFLGGALLDRATDILRHLLHRSADRGGKTTKAVRTVCALGSYPGKRSLPVVEVFLEPEGLAT